MGLRKKITVSWSGGKDAALGLQSILGSDEYEIENLHCIINTETGRVGLHGVREKLIQEQAESIQLPLFKAYLASSGSNHEYEALVKELYKTFSRQGISHIMFGDIFLEDLRRYREGLVREAGLIPVFPLWGKSSESCVDSIAANGFETILCAVNERCFNLDLLGRKIDADFRNYLPADVDPCGENGEFHTFVFNAPYFRNAIDYTLGEVTQQVYDLNTSEPVDKPQSIRFYFQDLVPSINCLKASNSN